MKRLRGPSLQLANKVCIVTGASRGLGRAIAIGLAEAGGDLALAARSIDGLLETQRLVMKDGRKAICVQTDVGDVNSVDNMVKETISAYGRVDILVNNAGVAPATKSIERWTIEEWDTTIRIDLSGVFYCSLAVGKQMIAQGGGCIINISSLGGKVPLFGQAPYGAAKAGVILLTKALGVEWARYNIRVNSVAPGATSVGIGEPLARDKGRYYEYAVAKIPMKRLGEANEVVPVVTFLASDFASYMTGQTIFVDGGWSSA